MQTDNNSIKASLLGPYFAVEQNYLQPLPKKLLYILVQAINIETIFLQLEQCSATGVSRDHIMCVAEHL